jgi:hypothetical protein
MTLRSTSNLTLNVPLTRTECGKRALRVGAPTIYNNQPADVLSSDSATVSTFKKRLKTILFVRAFADYLTLISHLNVVQIRNDPLHLQETRRFCSCFLAC